MAISNSYVKLPEGINVKPYIWWLMVVNGGYLLIIWVLNIADWAPSPGGAGQQRADHAAQDAAAARAGGG